MLICRLIGHIWDLAVNPERTFLEKIFLPHEEFHRPKDKMRVDRLSRHLYDVVTIAKTEFAEKALSDPGLYQTIVDHRWIYTRVGGVDYNLLQPKTRRSHADPGGHGSMAGGLSENG